MSGETFKVLLGMTGGVDSSVAAWNLKRDGHEVVGVTLLFHDSDAITAKTSHAAELAAQLGIEHHIIDVRERFAQVVEASFAEAATERATIVNPCLCCTNELKFPLLFEAADEYDCDMVATGHYANVTSDEYGVGLREYQLRAPLDRSKDQTFLLYRLDQDMLARLIFPLKDITKGNVRRLAMRAGLQRLSPLDDGQGMPCFFDGQSAVEWLERSGAIESRPGEVFNLSNKEAVGTHEGLFRYELGEEYSDGLCVMVKDVDRNELLVGPRNLAAVEYVELGDMFWTSIEPLERKRSCRVRTAYGTVPVPAYLVATDGGAIATFTTPVRGIHAGSPLVFYSDDLVLGGGVVIR